jgi:hypothetical protein
MKNCDVWVTGNGIIPPSSSENARQIVQNIKRKTH